MANRQEIASAVHESLEVPVTDAAKKVSEGMEAIVKAASANLDSKLSHEYGQARLAAEITIKDGLTSGKRPPEGLETVVVDAADGKAKDLYQQNRDTASCDLKNTAIGGQPQSKALAEMAAKTSDQTASAIYKNVATPEKPTLGNDQEADKKSTLHETPTLTRGRK